MNRFAVAVVSWAVLACTACGGAGDFSGAERTAGIPAGASHGGEADAGAGDCAEGSAVGEPVAPAGLAAPSGSTLVARYHVEGDQIYVCASSSLDVGGLGPPETSYAWLLGFPRAKLTGCAGTGSQLGPTWTSSDGSSVVAKPEATAPSPDAGALPWSLYEAVSSNGSGAFASVDAIQRFDTQGGAIPVEPCGPMNLHAERSVPFVATDYVYRQ
jgi:hypothetical protein